MSSSIDINSISSRSHLPSNLQLPFHVLLQIGGWHLFWRHHVRCYYWGHHDNATCLPAQTPDKMPNRRINIPLRSTTVTLQCGSEMKPDQHGWRTRESAKVCITLHVVLLKPYFRKYCDGLLPATSSMFGTQRVSKMTSCALIPEDESIQEVLCIRPYCCFTESLCYIYRITLYTFISANHLFSVWTWCLNFPIVRFWAVSASTNENRRNIIWLQTTARSLAAAKRGLSQCHPCNDTRSHWCRTIVTA